jgi:hypothetical protein
MSRTDLNTLVFRLRKDLLKAGIDGTRVIEREAGGVCVRLDPETLVEVL